MSEENYVNGKLEGPYKTYFPDGTPTEIASYKNGLLDGRDASKATKRPTPVLAQLLAIMLYNYIRPRPRRGLHSAGIKHGDVGRTGAPNHL